MQSRFNVMGVADSISLRANCHVGAIFNDYKAVQVLARLEIGS